jgi:hypothetical protein
LPMPLSTTALANALVARSPEGPTFQATCLILSVQKAIETMSKCLTALPSYNDAAIMYIHGVLCVWEVVVASLDVSIELNRPQQPASTPPTCTSTLHITYVAEPTSGLTTVQLEES